MVANYSLMPAAILASLAVVVGCSPAESGSPVGASDGEAILNDVNATPVERPLPEPFRNAGIPTDADAALESPHHFELISLQPTQDESENGFHGWQVLGKTIVERSETRRDLVAAFRKGVQENKGIAAGCFQPRHAIRVVRGETTIDFVICFECMNVGVFEGTKRGNGFHTTSSPQPLFDEVLTAADVTLAPKSS